MSRFKPTTLLLGLALVASVPSTVAACPFCTATGQTYSEEIASMDAVVFAELIELPADTANSDTTEFSKAKFRIVDFLKGADVVGDQRVIETLYFGDGKVGESFLVMGVDPPKMNWSTPLRVSQRARDYLKKLVTLPEKGTERLLFFQSYFEDDDEMLAGDAYDEFAKAPYDQIKLLKKNIDHDQLVDWIKSTDVPASRRRLYLTLLGVCGNMNDLKMLETMMRSSDRKQKSGLDALIGCYLTLSGESGMPLVEDLFLKNKKAEYADTYAAIMALRFHGTETDIVPRSRILVGLRYMLERPKLADLVIPDLARWEDWSVMDKLVELFKTADEKSSWVRVPVVNYLRACPLPEAKEKMAELEKVDPAAVKRANTFFPFSPKEDTSSLQQSEEKAESVAVSANKPVISNVSTTVAQEGDSVASAQPSVALPRSARNEAGTGFAGPPVATQPPTNRLLLFGVPVFMGAALMLLMWSILRGTGYADGRQGAS